jgi:hypothetical protein
MRLSMAKLTAQKDKYQFILPAMSVFGHIVENGLIKPDEKKVAAIQRITKVNTKTHSTKPLPGALSLHPTGALTSHRPRGMPPFIEILNMQLRLRIPSIHITLSLKVAYLDTLKVVSLCSDPFGVITVM